MAEPGFKRRPSKYCNYSATEVLIYKLPALTCWRFTLRGQLFGKYWQLNQNNYLLKTEHGKIQINAIRAKLVKIEKHSKTQDKIQDGPILVYLSFMISDQETNPV